MICQIFKRSGAQWAEEFIYARIKTIKNFKIAANINNIQMTVKNHQIGISRFKFDLESRGMIQNVAFLFGNCNMLIFLKIKNSYNENFKMVARINS